MWHYQAGRSVDPAGEDWLEVHEVFPDVNGERLWTEDGMRPGGATKDELIECLRMMLRDVAQHEVFDSDHKEAEPSTNSAI